MIGLRERQLRRREGDSPKIHRPVILLDKLDSVCAETFHCA